MIFKSLILTKVEFLKARGYEALYSNFQNNIHILLNDF